MLKPRLLQTPRRGFIGRAAALTLGLGLSACGGGGDGKTDSQQDPGEQPPPPGGISPAQRMASIGRTEAAARELQRQSLSPLAYVQALAARMAQDPNYSSCGHEPDGLCAWGEFSDGRLHLVSHNFKPGRSGNLAASAPSAPSVRALAAEPVLPASRQARLLHSFGADFDGQDAISTLSPWLRRHGYTPVALTEGDAGLAQLRAVQGDGFFYLNTHGGFKRMVRDDPRSPLRYSVQSSTPVTEASEAQADIQADHAARRLTYYTGTTGRVLRDANGEAYDERETRYGITAEFVDRYWQFAEDSTVFMNACNSANTAGADLVIDFLVACHRKGAGLYLGWSAVVSAPAAFDIPKRFVDRVLGINAFDPPTPPQRPFSGEAVMAEMTRRGQHRDPNPETLALLLARPNPRAALEHLLAPGLRELELREIDDELLLHGSFGRRQGEVKIGEQTLTVRNWEPERIVCELPRSGPGSSGPVQVICQGAKSNLRRLAEWNLVVDMRWIKPQYPGLQVDGQLRLRWRADIGPVREQCGGEVELRPRHALATLASNAQLAASGTYAESPDCSITWSGAADYPSQVAALKAQVPPGRVLYGNLMLDLQQREGMLGLAIGDSGTQPFIENHCRYQNGFMAGMGLLDGVHSFHVPGAPAGIPLPAKQLALRRDGSIAADGHADAQLRLRWGEGANLWPAQDSDAI